MRGMPTYRYTQFVEHYRRYAQTLTDLTGGTLRFEYAAFVSTNRRHYLPPHNPCGWFEWLSIIANQVILYSLQAHLDV